jgi:quinone-modifying oxidoreductase subunit QmoC
VATAQTTPEASESAAPTENGAPVRLDPDLDFIQAITEQAGGTFKRCFQCGTCSSTCELSPEVEPFPRKEMAWAAWGLRDRLLADPDVWLCHQCNDCSDRCPRGGRPGDVLAAVRREAVATYAFPTFLARWVNRPRMIPMLLGIPAAILTAALLLRDTLGGTLGFERPMGDRIIYSYSNMLPQWLINLVFGLATLLVVLLMAVGVARQWRSYRRDSGFGGAPSRRGLAGSLLGTIANVFVHRRFKECKTASSRFASHLMVVFGFLALTLVTIWVITARWNPLIPDGLIYPFGFWHPWKILANLGGLGVVIGCSIMVVNRLRDRDAAGSSTWFDWSLLSLVLAVALTGFLTEILHYTRYEPHRHGTYFIHLVLVLALILYLPYSKLAHVVYRTAAMIFAERVGRDRAPEADGRAVPEPAAAVEPEGEAS